VKGQKEKKEASKKKIRKKEDLSQGRTERKVTSLLSREKKKNSGKEIGRSRLS